MIDLRAIFRNRTPVFSKLLAFGFSEKEEGFCKEYPILQESFKVNVSVSRNGDVDFRVYDCDLGEEYLLAHVYDASGAFVGKVHLACDNILREIAEKCFCTEVFRGEQTKRILRRIEETCGARPEFLWERFPEFAALRVPGKKPWFAMLGRIPKDRLGLSGEGLVETINLKGEPSNVRTYIEQGLAFPAYHMNKQHWFTLLLDDGIADEVVLSLVDDSFAIVEMKR